MAKREGELPRWQTISYGMSVPTIIKKEVAHHYGVDDHQGGYANQEALNNASEALLDAVLPIINPSLSAHAIEGNNPSLDQGILSEKIQTVLLAQDDIQPDAIPSQQVAYNCASEISARLIRTLKSKSDTGVGL